MMDIEEVLLLWFINVLTKRLLIQAHINFQVKQLNLCEMSVL